MNTSPRSFHTPHPVILRFVLLALVCLATLRATPAHAHSMPNSAVLLDFHRDGVAAELILPLNELELGFQQPLMPAPGEVLARHGEALKDYVRAHVNPTAPDDRAWSVAVRGMSVQMGQAQPDLVVHVWMQPPPGAPLRQFTLNYSVICHEVMNHSAIVSVRNDWDHAVFSQPQLVGAIQYTIKAVKVDRTGGGWWQGFRSVLRLGVAHIAEGIDHLLFLLVLLLPAPLLAAGGKWGAFGGLRRSFVQLLKVVSAFTIGHSLTLLIGAVGWLQLPSQPVEILIAVSILVSAVHAARPIFVGREMWIASGFGLVHGLAFAGVIAAYGFSPWYMAMSILGFNLGIELMQLLVVAVTIPWLLLLSRTRAYTPVRLAGAAFAAAASLCWIGERAFAWPNPFESVVTALASRPLWIVAALAALALTATWKRQILSVAFAILPRLQRTAVVLAMLLLPVAQSWADAANTQAVVTAATTFKAGLNSTQTTFIDSTSSPVNSSCQYNFLLSNVEVWSNVPISTTLSGATRNGLIFSGITTAQQTNALAVATAALNTTGKKLFDDVRAADRYISGEVTNAKGTTSAAWGYNKYFLGFVGAPSTSTAFTMQLGGHHAAFNITYNGTYTSGTPLFAGTEPNSWTDSTGTYAPLGAQRTALEALRPTLTTSALLSGTFSDVVFGPNGSGPGATGNHDTTQPKAYPTTGRGQLYSALTTTQQGYVRTFIEAWVNYLPASIASELLAIYESPQALAETYVGYAGTNTLMRASANYFRVDGPRCWIEFSVQGGVYDMTSYHDHGVFRDKLADYGAAYGSTTISTTVRPPTITTHPLPQSVPSGSNATFTVVGASAGAGTTTLSYQWYKGGVAISGATAASYTTTASASTVGSYFVNVISTGGLVASNTVTLALSPPTISTSSPLPGGVIGTAYSQTLAASGGSGAGYTYAVTSGSPPTNLTLSNAGVLSGTPTTAGTSNFTVTVTDSASATGTKAFAVTIAEPLAAFLSTYGISSATADGDGDGLSNAFEFLLGGNPTVSNRSILPAAAMTTVGGNPALVFSFNAATPLGGLTWSVEYSADLSTWTTAVHGTGGVTITSASAGAGVNLVTVTIPTTAPECVARLRVTPP